MTMTSSGRVAPSGSLHLRVIRDPDAEAPEAPPAKRSSFLEGPKGKGVSVLKLIRDAFPRPGLPREVNRWRLSNSWRLVLPIARLWLIQRVGGAVLVPQLRLTLLKEDGRVLDLGLAGMKLVTTAGVNYLVDALQGSVEPENFNYHGFGTGGGAEDAANTGLTTELTTEYVTNSTRPTGTPGEGASANIYRTVGTLSPDSGGTLAITEHGVFSANAAGTLLDKTLFSAVNVVASADSLQATYELTLATGS